MTNQNKSAVAESMVWKLSDLASLAGESRFWDHLKQAFLPTDVRGVTTLIMVLAGHGLAALLAHSVFPPSFFTACQTLSSSSWSSTTVPAAASSQVSGIGTLGGFAPVLLLLSLAGRGLPDRLAQDSGAGADNQRIGAAAAAIALLACQTSFWLPIVALICNAVIPQIVTLT